MTRGRRFIVISLTAVAAIVGIAVWRIETRFIYTHWFGERRFGIEYRARGRAYGTEYPVLNTSFYYPPALIVGIKSFRLPDSRTPSFRIVSDTENNVHCVYDTLGWGYLALIDTSTEKCSFFCTSGATSSSDDGSQWRPRFDRLLRLHPEIPYADAVPESRIDIKDDAG